MTLQGHFENGVIVLDEPANLPDGVKVRVELVPNGRASQDHNAAQGTPLDHYRSIIGAVDDLPSDFANQHDHYIHGTPKK